MNRHEVARGGLGGAAATVLMTAALLAARRLRLVDTPAPEAVTTGALEQVHLDDEVRPPARTALVAVTHLGYGTAMGAVYCSLPRRLRRAPLPCGAVFGFALWAAGYAGWAPAFGVLPPPRRQGAGRHVENITGHLVYGAALGWLEAQRRPERNPYAQPR